MADLAAVNALRNAVEQRYASGDLTSPWNIAASSSDPWWEVANPQAANQNWWMLKQGLYGLESPSNAPPESYDLDPNREANYQAAVEREWFNQGVGYSPLSYGQYRQAQDALKSAPAGSFIDTVGRVITPGSVIGGYKYTPQQYGIDDVTGQQVPGITVAFDPLGGALDGMWTWAGQGAEPAGSSALQQLKNAGVIPSEEWRGTLGPKGLETILNLGSVLAPGLGQYVGAAEAGGMTIADAVASGASASDLAALGFSNAQIAAYGATNASSLLGNELVSAGANPTVANALASGATGAARGAAMGAITGGDPLYGAALGGTVGAVGGGVSTGTGSQLGGALAADLAKYGVSTALQPSASTGSRQATQNALARTQTPAYNAFADTTQGVTHQPIINPQIYTPYNVFARS